MSVELERLWHLRDAIMNTAWKDMLAIIRQDIEELRARGVSFDAPEWWSENLAPAAAAQEVRHLSDHELMLSLRCNQWAVETMFRDDLYQGKLVCWRRPGSSLADYKRAPAWAVIGIESWWKGGGILRLESGERLYAARVEPAAVQRTVPESEIAKWLRAHPGMSERGGLHAARRDLGGTIPRSRFRAVRKRLGISLPAGRK